MYCIKCGSVIGEGNKFCMKCGTPVGSMPQAAPEPAPGPAPAPGPVYTPVQAEPMPGQAEEVQTVPYYQPVMDGAYITLPMGRKYRVFCPDCGQASDNIKNDTGVGFACSFCNRAYAYCGQLLVYRMGSFYPLYAGLPMSIIVDGIDYGRIANQESVRVMLPPGQHEICCGNISAKRSNAFQITVSPEYNNFAFKFNLVYHGPWTYPGRGVPMEFTQCAPEEIPNI